MCCLGKSIPKLFYAVGVVLLLLTFFHCDTEDNPKQYPTSVFNFDSLKSVSQSFVPAIGKLRGRLAIPLYHGSLSFNPIINPQALCPFFEGLVRIDPATGKSIPHLAEKWEPTQDSLTWKFFLRKGVLWSDSTPFSAYDVQFTFDDLIFNTKIPNNVALRRFQVGNYRIEVTVIDSFTISFKVPYSFTYFLRQLTQEILPRHRYEPLVRNKLFHRALSMHTSSDSVVGTGPFLFSSYIPLSAIHFTKNPHCWQRDSTGGQLPYVDTVTYVLVSELDEALHCLLNGEIDFIAADGLEYTKIKNTHSTFDYFHLGPSFTSSMILCNLNGNTVSGSTLTAKESRRWIAQKSFRKALAYAIDRQKIIDTTMKGKGFVQRSPVSPTNTLFYSDKCVNYTHDIEKAKALLKEIGLFDTDNDGYVNDSSGSLIELTLEVNSGNTFRMAIAEALVKDLKRIGIKLLINQEDQEKIFAKLANKASQWDLVLTGITEGIDPYSTREIWYTAGENHVWSNRKGSNRQLWQRKTDSLFDQSIIEMNEENRRVLFSQWQHLVSDELPAIFLVRNERVLIINKRVKNVNPTLFGGILHNLNELYIE